MVVDDHPVVRKGIVSMLSIETDINVVGECANGKEAVEKSKHLSPDVIVMDLVMPEMDGVEAIQKIKENNPSEKILVLTSFTSDEKVFAAIEAGASGYLLKDSDPDELVRAIHQVFRGESSLHPQIARKLLNQISKPKSKKPSINELNVLTEREIEVLTYLGKGLTNQDIAENLFVSKATVHTHVSNILAKLNLTNRTQAALFAQREGLEPKQ
ncbi:MAG: DNA-binding response regulator [Anaerolineaceae bacterium]|nr:DNA-binding response regulator [Anaerolineaceae bacterium]